MTLNDGLTKYQRYYQKHKEELKERDRERHRKYYAENRELVKAKNLARYYKKKEGEQVSDTTETETAVE